MSTTIDQPITTTITRGYHGLQAKTRLSLGTITTTHHGEPTAAERILDITTSKRESGGIASSAYAYLEVGNTKTFEVFGDYRSARLTPKNHLRATEKNIKLIHAEALQQVDRLVEEAQAFYARKTVPEIAF